MNDGCTRVAKHTFFGWLISSVSWLVVSSVWGQSNQQISGQVVDQQTGAPLPFVAIYVPTQRIGTLTNEAGFFSLRPGATLPTDTISFSLIGYQTLHLTQQTLRQYQPNRPLQLKPSPTLLTEVTVRPRITADKLIQAVIRRIADNYPDQPYLLQAFDREWTRFKPGSLPRAVSIAQPEQRFLALAEGQLEIYKGRYTERAGVDEVRVLKARRKPLATYFRYNADTCRLPLITNGPALGLLLDIVRFTDQMTFLNPDQLSFYVYDYESETTIDGHQIVVVGFKPKSERSLVSYFTGRLFIDSQSLAVVRGEFSVAPAGLSVVNKAPRFGRLWLRLSNRQYVVNYRRQANGRYVLNDGQVANEYTYADHPDVCIQNRLSLVVTQLSYGHVQPFNRSEAISFNQSLVEQMIPFEPGFWANDNIIADEP